MFRRTSLGICCALLALSTTPAWSQPLEWNKATGTQGFLIPANWTPNAAPGLADDVMFGPNLVGLDVDVVLGALAEANNMTFTDGVVEFIGFGSATLNNNGAVLIDDLGASGLGDGAQVILNGTSGVVWDSVGDATVGDMGFGSLTINNDGNFTASSLYLGDDLGAEGEVNVDGISSVLTADAVGAAFGIFIGNEGTGTMNVTGGGLVQTTDAAGAADISLGFAATGEGSLNISGAGSRVAVEDFFVGESGTGHLLVSAGGVMDGSVGPTPDAFIAQGTGSIGNATVTGDGSQWQTGRLEVGNLGQATLSVEAGGLVSSNSNDMTLGDAGGSGKVAVFGVGVSNSTLSVANDLFVGNLGLGELSVGRDLAGNANGNGTLSVGNDLKVGSAAGTTEENKVILDGAGVVATIGNALTVGDSAKGAIEIRGGANLSVGAGFNVGLLSNAEGTALIDGAGTAVTADNLFVGNGTGDGSTGVVTVSGGAQVTLTGEISPNNHAIDAITLGDDDEGVGTLNVTGANSLVQTTNALGGWFVGGSGNESGGTGTANISDGGQGISASRVVIGHGSGATGTLNIGNDNPNDAPAQFDANGDLVLVGFGGVGNLNVTENGTLNAKGMFVADAAGSAGSKLSVDGSGAKVNLTGRLWIGDSNRGSAEVKNGGAITMTPSSTAERLVIGVTGSSDGSQLMIDGAGGGARVDYDGTADVSVGFNGGSVAEPATLEVVNGGVFSTLQRDPNDENILLTKARIIVGDTNGGNGRIRVDGAGSLVEASILYLGDANAASSGILDITAGGAVNLTDDMQIGSFGAGTGTANITGPTSSLAVGTTLSLGDDLFDGGNNGAQGFLNVNEGATVTNGGSAYIGHYTGSKGTATLGSTTANTSTWSVGGELTLAGTETSSSSQNGTGTLNLEVGGLVDVASNVRIRTLGTVNLDGGELRFGDTLIFTNTGSTLNFNSGTLRSTNSTSFTLSSALIERILGPSGSLTTGQHFAIDGNAVIAAPLRVNGGTLSVGTITKANLSNVDFDAGTLNFTGTGIVVTDAGLFGSVLVVDEDETINTSGGLFVQSDGLLNVARGAISAVGGSNDGTIVIAEGTADFGAGLTNNGDLVLVDATTAGTITNNGNLTVVNSASLSALSLGSDGSLSLSLNGTDDFDALAIGGDALLDGLLDVEVSGFTLTDGNAFEILDIEGTSSGMFAGLADGALVGNFGGVDLFIDYDGGDGNDVVLFTTGGFSADFDTDGDVDADDLIQWQGDYGSTGSDADGDGDSDGSDFLAWQRQFGNGVGTAAASTVVPEPSSLVLATLAACLLARQRLRG